MLSPFRQLIALKQLLFTVQLVFFCTVCPLTVVLGQVLVAAELFTAELLLVGAVLVTVLFTLFCEDAVGELLETGVAGNASVVLVTVLALLSAASVLTLCANAPVVPVMRIAAINASNFNFM